MKYNFDEKTNRRRIGAVKWDVKENELPMWVADMDFPAAPEIRKALSERVAHGVFGYTDIPQEWYEAYIHWWRTRHGYEIQKDALIFTTGVIPAISTCVRKLSSPAEKAVVLTPVYNIFFNSIVNNGRFVLECPLGYENGAYYINWEDLEEKLSDPQASLLIFCNPHNPVGKIWSKEELIRVGELCKKHGVTVISDEIHCDITAPGRSYVPFAAASALCADISVTCIAPTKAFNLAGIQTAAVMVPNPFLRHKVWRALNTDEVAEPNAFACETAIAAFAKGGAWLDEMRAYVFRNRDIAEEFIEKNIPGIKAIRGEATYLLWLDCSEITADSRALCEKIREKTGLILSNGAQYGKTGEAFLRMNLAATRENVLDGLNRLKNAVLR